MPQPLRVQEDHSVGPWDIVYFSVLGFRVLGFRVLSFRVLGFRGSYSGNFCSQGFRGHPGSEEDFFKAPSLGTCSSHSSPLTSGLEPAPLGFEGSGILGFKASGAVYAVGV